MLNILAIIGLWAIITQTNGPFNLFFKIKMILFQNKYFGVFFSELFACPICLGFHLGYLIFILTMPFNIIDMFIWACIGSASCLIFSVFYYKEDNHDN